MRRRLILVVAASVTMVLLAMLVPVGVLLRNYALEDRLSRAALEVQATETVVSGQDKGAVAVYLDRINRGSGIETTVLYPDGTVIGPHDPSTVVLARAAQARETGQARIDDISGGAEFLVPVSLGGSSPGADRTPVVWVEVHAPGLESGILRSWLALLALGLVLLAAALLLADRLGRSFVTPLRRLATYAGRLGEPDADPRSPVDPDAPPEVRELAGTLERLVERIDVLLARERDTVSDLSHRLRTPITALRLGVDTLADPEERARLDGDLDHLDLAVDSVVREARRSSREGRVAQCDAAAVVAERTAFWSALAEDQVRGFAVDLPPGPVPVRAGADDLAALLDVLLDNVFSHTPEGADVAVSLTAAGPGGVVRLRVDDAGPGFPEGVEVLDRGTSGAGSTGLGLAIADATARQAGGGVVVGRSDLGGARVEITLGSA